MHVIHTAKSSLAASLVCSHVNHYKCQHNPKQKSREQLEDKLIIAVANNPVLYDQSLFSYRDLIRRAHAWRDVAEAVGEAGMNSCVVM